MSHTIDRDELVLSKPKSYFLTPVDDVPFTDYYPARKKKWEALPNSNPSMYVRVCFWGQKFFSEGNHEAPRPETYTLGASIKDVRSKVGF